MILFSTLNETYVLWLFLYLGAICGVIFFALCKLFSIFDRRKLLKKDIFNNEKMEENDKKTRKMDKKEQNLDKNSNFSKKNDKIEIAKSKKIDDKTKEKSVVKQENFLQKIINVFSKKIIKKLLNKLIYFFTIIFRKNKQKSKKIFDKNNPQNISKNAYFSQKISEKKEKNKRKKNCKNNKKIAIKNIFISIKIVFIKLFIFIGQIFSQIGKFVVFIALCFATFFINLKLNYGEINFICIVAYLLSFFLAGYFFKTVANFFLWLYTKNIKKKEL